MKHCPANSKAARFLAQGRAITDNAITYMLRSNNADMTAYGGFTYPRKGEVSAPDWDASPRCGGGLHGLLRGEGDANLTHQNQPGAVWLVCAVWRRDVVDLSGEKIKVPRAWVAFAGSRDEAVAHMQSLGCRMCIYGTETAGIGGTATAGNRGTATAGYGGTATAGYGGTATAGNRGTATVGNRGTATAGYGGTATAGDWGTATAGNRGTATAGDWGTATAGDWGTATAGYGGEIRIRWHDGKRFRTAVGYVGENGIEPNVPYVVRGGQLVRK